VHQILRSWQELRPSTRFRQGYASYETRPTLGISAVGPPIPRFSGNVMVSTRQGYGSRHSGGDADV